jgi:hypothetical protein
MFMESACAIAVVLAVVVAIIAIAAHKSLRAVLDAAVSGALYDA